MSLRLLAVFCVVATLARADPDFDAAVALEKAKKYPEARVAFEKIVTTDPKNAAAYHELGLLWQELDHNPKETAPLEQAVKAFSRAVELEPNNAIYLTDFGGASLDFAGRTMSLSSATKGRDALEKALTIKPDHVPAREALYRFYAEAPWPIGSSSKANAQLNEIRKYDSDRALTLLVLLKSEKKDYAAAFSACTDALAVNPTQYLALFFYGRTAALSGQNLERGLANLQKCLTLSPPQHTPFGLAAVWTRLGNVQEKLNHLGEARDAYKEALALDPKSKLAADSLAKLAQSESSR
jgi:tetratricopeptide (TPR) repeat protein